MDFETVDKSARDVPLMKGKFYALDESNDATDVVIDAMTEYKKRDPLKLGKQLTPMILLDLALPEHVKIQTPEGQPIEYPKAEQKTLVRALVPAALIVDLKDVLAVQISGNSRVKVNQAFPVYIWFHAANMLFTFNNTLIRLIPFPIEQEEDKKVVYQMLAVNMEEYKQYEEVLHFGIREYGLEEGFASSARFAYEILRHRGVKEISHEHVDAVLTHVFLDNHQGVFEGCLFYPLNKFELEHKELIEKYIYTI